MKCSLYRVIHIASGNDYVGISIHPVVRWKEHRYSAARGESSRFYNALRKYGPDAFTWNVIAWCSSFDVAKDLERLARHLGLGAYNLTMGGDGMLGFRHSPESRKRISENRRGVSIPPSSDEHYQKLRDLFKGKPLSDETKMKMSAVRKGRPWTAARRAALRKDS